MMSTSSKRSICSTLTEPENFPGKVASATLAGMAGASLAAELAPHARAVLRVENGAVLPAMARVAEGAA